MINELNIRVYFEDTDAGGVVFYANYLRYAERGRTEFLRDMGYESSSLMKQENIAFVVRHLEADYMMPARLDDQLVLRTTLESVKNASFVMKQSIFCQDNAVFEMYVTLVAVSLDTIRPAKFSDEMRNKLLGLIE